MANLQAADEAVLPRKRIDSVDLLRGVIIVLMALDHSHDFFGDFAANPVNLTTTTVALFFTRWVTHFCAPVFFLLTGTGAYLTRRRMPKPALARFLATRGLWLIFLELTAMRFALQFNIDYHVTIITVLWALGWAMIVLAGLIWLPNWAIAAFALVTIAGHNLLDGIGPQSFGALAPLWNVLHSPGIALDADGHLVLISYVLIPWVGVTALGYALGQAYEWSTARRERLLFWIGLGLVAGFIALRYANVYGDPVPWQPQKSALWTVMALIDTTKYPPSLLFLMMTLGPAMLLLGLFDRGVPAFLRPALVFGRVPLFFYVIHFYLIHLLAMLASWLRYGEVRETFSSPDLAHFPFAAPPGWAAPGLPLVYGVWIAVIAIMYPLCRWYAGVRRRNAAWWLSYL
ncbi:MAG TPA: heparan-alpha-glucosaminide N-acetyltransferase domain-containing protein [Rhizomicrobium sp.]|nr:heparan-alpha-glucosaminide N-acetyltransferase domain-containing protein [Rhizomicrobium sp.]